jgi:hypothetical protein
MLPEETCPSEFSQIVVSFGHTPNTCCAYASVCAGGAQWPARSPADSGRRRHQSGGGADGGARPGWGREQRGFGGGGAYRAAGICMDGGAAVVAGRGEQRWR